MADNPQKPMKTKESDSAREAGTERTHVRPEVAKSAQVDARGMQEVESTRTNKHSGSASELEWNRGSGDRGSGTDSGKNSARGGIDGKGDKSGNSGKGNKDGGDGDSITIEAVDEHGKKFTVASRVSGGTERDYLAKGEKPQERFHTGELKAIQTDQSLPAEKRALAQQLQEMRSLAKDANQPTAEIDRFASETFKDEIRNMRSSGSDDGGTFQAISDTDLAKDTNLAKGTDLTKSASPSDAASPQTQPQTRHLDEDGRPIVDHQPEQMDKKTFSLGLTYEEGTPPPAETPGEKGADKVAEVAAKPAATDAPHQKGITEVMSELGNLPLDKQIQVVGMGIKVFQESLHKQQVDIAKGVGEGVKEGFEAIYEDAANLVKGVGQAWQFGEDVMTNNPRALETSAKAGEAIGQTLVGGVRLFQMSHDYLYNIGYTGDYSKPFKDISNLAQELDRRWNEMTPAEQARMTAKFSTQFLGEMAIPMGASKIAKSEKITTALEEIALKAKAMGGKATGKVAEGIADVVDGLTDMVTPTEELATAGGPPLGRRKLSDLVEERRKLGDEDFFKRPTTPEVAEVASESPSRRILHQPADGVSGDEYIEKLPLKEKFLDYLDNIGFGRERRLRNWEKMEEMRLAELPDPLDSRFTDRQAAEIAVERMVKPWGIENPKVLEHYEQCKKAILETIPTEDIMALYGKGGEDSFRFHFPNRLADVHFEVSAEKAYKIGSELGSEIGGVTLPDERFTCVPRLRWEAGGPKLLERLADKHSNLNLMERLKQKVPKSGWHLQVDKPDTEFFREYRIEGVVRHEVGMALIERYGWDDTTVKDMYDAIAPKVRMRFETLALMEERAQKFGLPELDELSLHRRQFSLLAGHMRPDIGLDQVLADLYAIKHGGSSYGAVAQQILQENFREIFEHLESKNWYRGK